MKFMGNKIPKFSTQRLPAGKGVYLKIQGAKNALNQKDITPPNTSLFQEIELEESGDELKITAFTRKKAAIEVNPGSKGLELTVSRKGMGGRSFSWSSSEAGGFPDPKTPLYGSQSAHDMGRELDKQITGKVTSSQTFTGSGIKPLLVIGKNVKIYKKPSSTSPMIQKPQAGTRLMKTGSQGKWFIVETRSGKGYVQKSGMAFLDEVSEEVIAAIEKQSQSQLQPESQAKKQNSNNQNKVGASEDSQNQGVALEEKQQLENLLAKEKERLQREQEMALKLSEERELAEQEKRKRARVSAKITYNNYGRRDPYIPVDKGGMEAGLEIDQLQLVGIVWDPEDPFAILEHSMEEGVSYTLKHGDPVKNGRVSRITKDGVSFNITEYGVTRSYTLKLASVEEGKRR